MFIMKQRLPKGTTMLFLLTMLITVCASLMLSNLYNKDLLFKYVRGYYSQNSHQLHPEDNISYQALEKALVFNTSDGVMLYKTSLESMYDTRGVFAKSQSTIPPMLSGRFFMTNDYISQSHIAVVGSFFEKDIKQNNGQKQITLFNKTFDVIGIMGSNEPTRLDTMIWIPLDTAVLLTGISGDYMIDGSSSLSVKKDIEALHGLMRIKMDSYNGELRESALEDLTNAPDTVTYVYLSALLSFLVSIIFACAYWISYRNMEVYVKRLNGYNNASLLLSLLLRYFACVLPAAIVGSATAFITQLFVFGGSILAIHLMLGIMLSVLPGMFIVVFQIVQSVLRREIKPAREWL